MILADWFNVLVIVGLSIFSVFAVVMMLRSIIRPKHQKIAKYAGSMIINTTDPKKDVIRIELDMSVAEMTGEKQLIFKVVNEDEVGS